MGKFVLLICLPCAVVALLAYSLISSAASVKFNWMELGYAVFFARVFYVVVDAAQELSSDAIKYRKKMLREIAFGNAAFADATALQQNAFLHWLTDSYKGFSILGFVIDARFSSWIRRSLYCIFVPLLYKVCAALL